MITLSDGVEWQEGHPVYWFGIYNTGNPESFLKFIMHKEVPIKANASDGKLSFLFSPRQKSQYGYYSSYDTAAIALAEESKKAYKELMARQLATMRIIKKEADWNSKLLQFAFQGQTNILSSDEIEALGRNRE